MSNSYKTGALRSFQVGTIDVQVGRFNDPDDEMPYGLTIGIRYPGQGYMEIHGHYHEELKRNNAYFTFNQDSAHRFAATHSLFFDGVT